MNDSDFFSGGKYIFLPFLKSKKAALPSDDRKTLDLTLNIYNPFSLKGRLLKKIKCFFYFLSYKKIKKGALIIELENKLKIEFISAVYWATDKNKIVVQLINKDTHKIYGYLKISCSKLGDGLIKNEIFALEQLGNEVSPQLLFSGYWKNSPYFIMSHIEGKALNNELDAQVLASILSQFKLSNNKTKLKEHQRFITILEYLKIVEEYDFGDLVFDDIHIYPSMEHGDFAPWNIITNKSNRIELIDFEMYLFNGIEGLDLIKYYFQYGYLVNQFDGIKLIEYIESKVQMDNFNTLFLLFLLKEICNKHQKSEDLAHDIYILGLLKDLK